MFDVTFLIPDYPDDIWQTWRNMFPLPPPDDEIPKAEKERLFEELCAMIDAGAFEPEREILF